MRRKGETFRKGTPLVLAPAIDEHRTRLRIWTDAGKVVVFDPSMTVFGRLFSGEAQDAVEYCNPVRLPTSVPSSARAVSRPS